MENIRMDSRSWKSSVFAGLLLLSVILPACSDSEERDVRRRLENSIEGYETKLTPSSRNHNVVAALRQATVQTLQVPRIVYTRLVESRSGSVVLIVYWLEKSPTPDALMLRNEKTRSQHIFTIDPMYAEQINADAKEYVVFQAAWRLDLQPEDWQSLQPQLQEGELESVLIHDGKPVSNVTLVERWSQQKPDASTMPD